MTSTSRTFHLAALGGAFQLKPASRDVTQPAAQQVLIRIAAASLNYRDLLTLQDTASNRDGLIPLSDGAGTVVAVGTGVTRWKAGDRVSVNFFPTWQGGPFSPAALATALGGGQTDGMLSEFVLADAASLVAHPRASEPDRSGHLALRRGDRLARPLRARPVAARRRPSWCRARAASRCSVCNWPLLPAPRSS